MAKYTVTEGLVKLKLASKKITDATNYVVTGAVATKGANVAPGGFKNPEDFKSEVKQRLDSVAGLIAFRDKLKFAIVQSNAATRVQVGKRSLTVAEAIETKQSLTAKKALLNKMVNEWTLLERDVTNRNQNIEQRADAYVAQLFAQNTAATQAEKDAARRNFIENNTAVIVTHDSVKTAIAQMKSEIDDFEANVDVALSVVNAHTELEVPE